MGGVSDRGCRRGWRKKVGGWSTIFGIPIAESESGCCKRMFRKNLTADFVPAAGVGARPARIALPVFKYIYIYIPLGRRKMRGVNTRCVPVSLKNRMVPSSAVSVQMLERSYEKAPRHMSPSWSDETLPCMALEKRRREIFSAPFSELPVGFPSATWQTYNTSGHLND